MRQERMGVEGKGILRSLQNDTLPLIDLLIREALQNSLDAVKKDAEQVYVNIGICEFESHLLEEHFEGISDKLSERYSGQRTKAICISDKNTVGLTGNVRKKQGNIYNLIYTIQRNQEQKGAGGSWGLGKTSYFRIGNGIVIYYSRIETEQGDYEERLAGSLIEDSSNDTRILDNDRGIAWWGQKDKDSHSNYDSTYPITDSDKIRRILSIFNIEPYIDEETGTSIIIPFIDENRLIPKHEDEGMIPPWWEKSLEDTVKIAVQKWYGPRILNKYYEGAYLVASVNNKLLAPDDFQPFFRKIYDLYVSGLKQKGSEGISVDRIELRNRGISSDKGTAGWLSHGLFTKEDIKMTSPDYEVHPLEYFGYSNAADLEKTNSKIIVYARKPGMIVEYDINGEWSKTASPSDEGFIVGFFIPNSKGMLYDKFTEPGVVTLEDYLRKTEKSDHSEWEDVPLNNIKITIVSRIKRNVSRTLQENYNDSEEIQYQSKASVLGRKIGDILLPKQGISGKTPVKPGKPGTGETGGQAGGKTNTKRTSIDVLNAEINENSCLEVSFAINIVAGISADVFVGLRTGTKNYNEEIWKKDMGQSAVYPFVIEDIFIENIEDENIHLNSDDLRDERLSIHFTSFDSTSSFRLINNLDSEALEIKGKLAIRVKDMLMQPIVTVSEVSENV